jgi:hypothetical protein
MDHIFQEKTGDYKTCSGKCWFDSSKKRKKLVTVITCCLQYLPKRLTLSH